ncbi:glycoside hydrolase, partial [Ceraceosorus guamensis]
MRFLSLLTVALAAILLARVDAAPAVGSSQSSHLAPRAANSGFGTGRKIRGVNLGNWLVLEAWMQPELFAPYSAQGAIDTWTLMKIINDPASSASLLQGHYDSWITEDDFRQIKAAGLNTIRLPVPHYMFGDAAGVALKTTSGEPYIGSGLEIPYVDKALRWAKQYGLDVTFDMHTAPYSQNGFDNSGRQGPVGFRTEGGNPADNVNRLIFALTESVKRWVNDPSYGGVIKSIGVLNEPQMWNGNLTRTWMVSQVHKPAYKAIMGNITSNAPIIPSITFHDGFDQPLSDWDSSYTTAQGYTAGTTSLDTHRYQAWAPQVDYTWDQHISYTCGLSSELSNANRVRPTFVGEFSLATRCTNCSYATMSDNINAQNNATQNLFMRRFWEAQQVTYEKSAGWIMWSWKTASRGEWSYKDAMAQGWIPSN